MKITHLDVEKQSVTLEDGRSFKLHTSARAGGRYIGIYLEPIQKEMPELLIGDMVFLIDSGIPPMILTLIKDDYLEAKSVVSLKSGHFCTGDIEQIWRKDKRIWQRNKP